MSTNNLSVADVATKKIRELIESTELKGWMPIDSNVFGTKKFNVENLALKETVQSALTTLNNKIDAEANARSALGTRVTNLESKIRSALIFQSSLTVSQISNLNIDSLEPGFMYTASDKGTIRYTLESVSKTLDVEAYDEVAWSETGWYIVGRDHEVDLSDYTKTSELATVALSNDFNDLLNKPTVAQPDWNQTDSDAADYIKNKPSVTQADWDQTDSDAADFIKNKPSVTQADWDQTDSDAADYIKNKPEIPEPVKPDWDASSSDAAGILNKPTIPAYTSDLTNDKGFITLDDLPQPDWNQTDSDAADFIKNKPTIPVQAQADWNQSDSDAADYIKNKPNIGPSLQVSTTNNWVGATDAVYIYASDGYIRLESYIPTQK